MCDFSEIQKKLLKPTRNLELKRFSVVKPDIKVTLKIICIYLMLESPLILCYPFDFRYYQWKKSPVWTSAQSNIS